MKKLLQFTLFMCISTFANSGIIIYNNDTSWENDVVSFSTEDFSSSPLSSTTANFSQTFNNFTIHSTTHGENVGVTNNASSNCQNTALCAPFANQNFFGWRQGNGGHGPDFSISGLTTSIGFDFFNSDFSDDYKIFVNGSHVSSFNKSNGGFFGVVATGGETITSFQIMHHATGGYVALAGIDNVRVATTNVPEPSAIALLGFGLLAFFGINRRKVNK